MKYLKEIQIGKHPRIAKNCFRIPLSDITLLVGNQGVGKSTILQAISRQPSEEISPLRASISKVVNLILEDSYKGQEITSYYFDSESMNPRTADPIANYTRAGGGTKGIGLGNALSSRFRSHGEVLQHFTVEPLRRVNDAVILLDEPESGLSLLNQYRLIRSMGIAVENGCQIVVTTHSLAIIQHFPYVFDVGEGKLLESGDFIQNQIRESLGK